MNIVDTVPADTVEPGDTISFVFTVDDEQFEEILTVASCAFYPSDGSVALSGYSHIDGENVIRYVDPDLEVDVVGEL